MSLLVRSVDEERHPVAFAFLEQVGERHPTEPHWYLPFIGVDPVHQGREIGSALLRSGLAGPTTTGCPPTSRPPALATGRYTNGTGSS